MTVVLAPDEDGGGDHELEEVVLEGRAVAVLDQKVDEPLLGLDVGVGLVASRGDACLSLIHI